MKFILYQLKRTQRLSWPQKEKTDGIIDFLPEILYSYTPLYVVVFPIELE
jgi:hypothetical protein